MQTAKTAGLMEIYLVSLYKKENQTITPIIQPFTQFINPAPLQLFIAITN